MPSPYREGLPHWLAYRPLVIQFASAYERGDNHFHFPEGKKTSTEKVNLDFALRYYEQNYTSSLWSDTMTTEQIAAVRNLYTHCLFHETHAPTLGGEPAPCVALRNRVKYPGGKTPPGRRDLSTDPRRTVSQKIAVSAAFTPAKVGQGKLLDISNVDLLESACKLISDGVLLVVYATGTVDDTHNELLDAYGLAFVNTPDASVLEIR